MRAEEINQFIDAHIERLSHDLQLQPAFWVLVKSIRGLWEAVEFERDRRLALTKGERISELNPGKEVWVVETIKTWQPHGSSSASVDSEERVTPPAFLVDSEQMSKLVEALARLTGFSLDLITKIIERELEISLPTPKKRYIVEE